MFYFPTGARRAFEKKSKTPVYGKTVLVFLGLCNALKIGLTELESIFWPNQKLPFKQVSDKRHSRFLNLFP